MSLDKLCEEINGQLLVIRAAGYSITLSANAIDSCNWKIANRDFGRMEETRKIGIHLKKVELASAAIADAHEKLVDLHGKLEEKTTPVDDDPTKGVTDRDFMDF